MLAVWFIYLLSPPPPFISFRVTYIDKTRAKNAAKRVLSHPPNQRWASSKSFHQYFRPTHMDPVRYAGAAQTYRQIKIKIKHTHTVICEMKTIWSTCHCILWDWKVDNTVVFFYNLAECQVCGTRLWRVTGKSVFDAIWLTRTDWAILKYQWKLTDKWPPVELTQLWILLICNALCTEPKACSNWKHAFFQLFWPEHTWFA